MVILGDGLCAHMLAFVAICCNGNALKILVLCQANKYLFQKVLLALNVQCLYSNIIIMPKHSKQLGLMVGQSILSFQKAGTADYKNRTHIYIFILSMLY